MNVVIIDDDVLEVDEGFVIEKPVITESPGRLTVTATQINVTILDDDGGRANYDIFPMALAGTSFCVHSHTHSHTLTHTHTHSQRQQ